MTIVGKILVFVNLVFSLVVGGLVTTVYFTRANWESHSKQLKEQYDAATADLQQTMREKQEAQAKLAKQENDWRDALQALATKDGQVDQGELTNLINQGATNVVMAAAKNRDDAKRELQNVKEELATIKQAKNAASTASESTLTAAGARKDQIKFLEDLVNAERARKEAVIKERNDERAERIRAEVAAKTLSERSSALEDQLRDLARVLASQKNGGATVVRKPGDENPPRDRVEGRILSTDPEGSLVKLSVGSDSGLERGHTLKAFRMTGQGQYLGVIEILSVTPHEAVARPVKRPQSPLKVGDRVASQILPGVR